MGGKYIHTLFIYNYKEYVTRLNFSLIGQKMKIFKNVYIF